MKIQVKSSFNPTLKTDCLVVALKPAKKLSSQQSELNKVTGGLIARLQEAGEFDATKAQVSVTPAPAGLNAKKLVLIGTGDTKSLDSEEIRDLLTTLAKALKENKVNEVSFELSALIAKSDAAIVARQTIETLGDAAYQYVMQPKSVTGPKAAKEMKVTLCCTDRKQAAEAKKAAMIGDAINNGKTLAKDLGNMPGNVCTPSYLASQARKLSKSHGLKVKVLSEKDMSDLGMGSLLSVSKGSREPAKLIVMEYKGAKNKKEAPHALVGKGLTFDAGGISLKPSAKMDEMKYDMCGAASVFGAVVAAAELELPINVLGVVPSSENLPDGIANKPGDVVTSMSGQTIEILNTDAEGRLILCDALTYTERYKPQTVIDIATLTGAVIVALGHQTAGVMGNDQEVVDNLIAAGETSLDHAWQLPLKETYKKQLKSDYADLANIGGPSAGTITAGCFLSYFTEKFRWAHLDIAGTAWGGTAGKRATGRAVPALTQYLIDRC
ncbi:MAG: leucyl aminopeptidase [Gammaproteobacteria bacterium]|nr:leucyl aminopeptidase [Gammaproteobacteria bacterium]